MSSLHYRKKRLKDFSKTTGLVKPSSACFVTNDCEWIFCDAPCKTSMSASFKIVSFHLGVSSGFLHLEQILCCKYLSIILCLGDFFLQVYIPGKHKNEHCY
jgi:hypothetical protein